MSELTIQQLIERNISRCARWHATPDGDWTALEWAGAMCGEAGEAANAAKKLKRLESNMVTINEEARHYTTLDAARLEVGKECADTILYALLLCHKVRLNPEDMLRLVFNRKSVEYGFPERI